MRPIGRTLARSSALAVVLSLVMSATAFGVTWGPAVAVSASGHAYSTSEAAVVTGTQKVHVFYTEHAASYQAWYRRSNDGGATWAAPVRLSHSTAYGAAAAAIDRDGTTLDVVWWEWDASNLSRILYRNSLNSGTDWSTSMALTTVGDQGRADVARSGSRVTVSWTDGATGKVYVRISTNGGASFGARKSIGTTTNQPFLPDYTSYEGSTNDGDSAGTITVVWDASSTTIKMRRSTDGGATWGTLTTLETNSYGSDISLMTSASKIIVGYMTKTLAGSRATQRHSSDEGLHWTSAAYVGGAPSGPPIFAYSGGVLRTAYDRCNVDCSSDATYFRTSTDFGGTWSGESQASRTVHTPFAYPLGIGAIGSGQTVVIYEHSDGVGTLNIYARKTV